MAKQTINVGTTPNDGTGDKLPVAFGKVNSNFSELYQGKEDAIDTGTSNQYFRGDKVMATLNITAVSGLQTSLDAKAVAGDATGSGLTLSSGRLVGRVSTGTGSVESLDAATVKTFLKLDLVNNTADADKPVSTATQTALNTKEPSIIPGGAGQYYRGDKTFQDLNKAAVGLSQVDNTSDVNKPVFTATANGQVTAPGATAFGAGNRFLASDGTWKVPTSTAPAVFTSTTDGLTPASGGGQTKFLRADGTWAVPVMNQAFSTWYLVYGNVKNSIDTDVVKDAHTIVLANSIAKADAAATAQTVFLIFKNATQIGTITFAAAATTGVIAITQAADRNVVLGDVIDIVLQGDADATLNRVSIVLHN